LVRLAQGVLPDPPQTGGSKPAGTGHGLMLAVDTVERATNSSGFRRQKAQL